MGMLRLSAQEKLTTAAFLDSISLQTVSLVDVRSADEYANGHLATAQQLDWNDKETFVRETAVWDTSKPLYLYCFSGARSAKAANFLREKGFQVYELDGGLKNVAKEKLTKKQQAN